MQILYIFLFLAVILTGCKDEDKPLPPPPTVTYSYEIVVKEYGKWVCIKEMYLKDANGNPITPIEFDCNATYNNQCAYLFDGKDNVVSKGTSLYVDVKTNKPVALVDADYRVAETCAVDPSITIR